MQSNNWQNKLWFKYILPKKIIGVEFFIWPFSGAKKQIIFGQNHLIFRQSMKKLLVYIRARDFSPPPPPQRNLSRTPTCQHIFIMNIKYVFFLNIASNFVNKKWVVWKLSITMHDVYIIYSHYYSFAMCIRCKNAPWYNLEFIKVLRCVR